MSQLQDSIENIKSRLTDYYERFKETELYQKLSDRYETLSPAGQKIVKIVSGLFLLLILLFVPLSQISTSKDFVQSFENHRILIRDLFKTYRESNQASRFAQAPNSDMLIGSINSTLQREQLLPEQIISVAAGAAEGRLIPPNLMTNVVDVKLIKLNLRQIVDIGSRLSAISQSVKLKDLLMTANTELAGYFDVTYKLYTLNIPAPIIEAPPEPETKTKKKNNSESETDNE
jgi:hypothetical protein